MKYLFKRFLIETKFRKDLTLIFFYGTLMRVALKLINLGKALWDYGLRKIEEL